MTSKTPSSKTKIELEPGDCRFAVKEEPPSPVAAEIKESAQNFRSLGVRVKAKNVKEESENADISSDPSFAGRSLEPDKTKNRFAGVVLPGITVRPTGKATSTVVACFPKQRLYISTSRAAPTSRLTGPGVSARPPSLADYCGRVLEYLYDRWLAYNRCSICNDRLLFRFGNGGQGHLALTHVLSHLDIPVLQCRRCDFRGKNISVMADHLQRHHSIQNVTLVPHFIDRTEDYRDDIIPMIHRCFPMQRQSPRKRIIRKPPAEQRPRKVATQPKGFDPSDAIVFCSKLIARFRVGGRLCCRLCDEKVDILERKPRCRESVRTGDAIDHALSHLGIRQDQVYSCCCAALGQGAFVHIPSCTSYREVAKKLKDIRGSLMTTLSKCFDKDQPLEKMGDNSKEKTAPRVGELSAKNFDGKRLETGADVSEQTAALEERMEIVHPDPTSAEQLVGIKDQLSAKRWKFTDRGIVIVPVPKTKTLKETVGITRSLPRPIFGNRAVPADTHRASNVEIPSPDGSVSNSPPIFNDPHITAKKKGPIVMASVAKTKCIATCKLKRIASCVYKCSKCKLRSRHKKLIKNHARKVHGK